MPSKNTGIQITIIIIILALIGAVIPAASAATTCCPNINYDDYPFGVDPYYQFPIECICPFLDDAVAHIKQYPSSYWEYVIQTQNSTCSTCSGTTSTVSSISYSNKPLIIPEKDSLMTEYDKISISTSIKSKDQVLAKYLK